jgi:hypothetical protein
MENPFVNLEKSPANNPRRHGGWFGVILILAGLIIFAQQAGWLGPRVNWWALFILIPAFGSLSGAYYAFQYSQRFNTAVRSSLGSAVVLFTLTFMFLLGLDWSVYWPLMVIAPGVSVLLNGFGGREGLNMAFWIGLGAVYLGFGFLGINTGWVDLRNRFEPYNWWALAILIPAFGALIMASISMVQKQRPGKIIGLVIFAILMAGTGLIAFFSANWSLFAPVLLIAAGLGILLGIFGEKSQA